MTTQERRHYLDVHLWISKNYGKATKCEMDNCCYKNPKRFEWALIKGRKLENNISNFWQLCPSCHRKYDYTEERKIKFAISRTGKKLPKLWVAVKQYSLDGKFIKKWDSVRIAYEKLNIGRTSIINNAKGVSKSAGGFIWKYAKKHDNN